MKLFVSMMLAAVLAFGVSLGPAYAGCGKKVTNKGTPEERGCRQEDHRGRQHG